MSDILIINLVTSKVLVRKRHYNPGENRKLSPRYIGLCTIIRKMPNAVNFEVKNSKGKTSIIHHNRLKRFFGDSENTGEKSTKDVAPPDNPSNSPEEVFIDTSSSDDSSEEGETEEEPRRYPSRNR